MPTETPTDREISKTEREAIRHRAGVSSEAFGEAQGWHRETLAALKVRDITLSREESDQLLYLLAKHAQAHTSGYLLPVATLADSLYEKRAFLAERQGSIDSVMEEHQRRNVEEAAVLRDKIAMLPPGTPVSVEHVTTDEKYYLANLLTKAHLQEESAVMGHCIGTNDYYASRLERGQIEIFSIRDVSTHASFVTIQYDKKSRKILDMRGKNDALITYEEAMRGSPIGWTQLMEILDHLRIGFAYDPQGNEYIRGLLGAKSGGGSVPIRNRPARMPEQQLRSIARSALMTEDGDLAKYLLFTFPSRIPERAKLQALVREAAGIESVYTKLRTTGPLLADKERAQAIRMLADPKHQAWAYKALVNMPHLFDDEREKLLASLRATNDPKLSLRVIKQIPNLPEVDRAFHVAAIIGVGRPALAYDCLRKTKVPLTDGEIEKLVTVVEKRKDAWEAYYTFSSGRVLPPSSRERLFRIVLADRHRGHWSDIFRDTKRFTEQERLQVYERVLKIKDISVSPYIWDATPEQRTELIQKLQKQWDEDAPVAFNSIRAILQTNFNGYDRDNSYKGPRGLEREHVERLFKLYQLSHPGTRGGSSYSDMDRDFRMRIRCKEFLGIA